MQRVVSLFSSSFVLLALGSITAGCDTPNPAIGVPREADGDATAPRDGGTVDAGDDAHDAGSLRADGGTADAGTSAEDAGTALADAGSEPASWDAGWLVAPASVCAPIAAACAPQVPTEVNASLFATLRKDVYFATSVYDEETPEPIHGGRVHIAALAAASGRVTRILVNGIDTATITAPNPTSAPPFEWAHAWPLQLVAGAPLFVAFHSRAASWTDGAPATLRIETDQGVALDGTFHATVAKVPLTYVTTLDGYQSLAVHVTNTDGVAHELSRLLVNGREVTDAACIADRRLQPGASAMWTVPLCQPLAPGAAWAVVAQWDGNTSRSVGVGRVVPEHFVIETWNNSTECAFPSGEEDEYQRLVEASIDTIYVHGGTCAPERCDCTLSTLISEELPSTPTQHAILAIGNAPPPGLTDVSRIAAFATGDESDGSVYEDNGVPHAAGKAAASRRAWQLHPQVPTFNGGKTNRNIGTFAGTADIQGMDFYIAACAPHITRWGQHPPARAAFDYLVNTRRNHMPLPTWLYSQGLSPAWNQERPFTGTTVHVQPDPQEIWLQGMSVVAAGAKGLLWFQSNATEAAHAPARWQAISEVSTTVRALRDLLREGDPVPAATVSGKAIAEAILTRGALIVVVLNLASSDAPTDLDCLTALVSENLVPHWVFAEQTLQLSVNVPDQLGVHDIFEVRRDGIVEVPPPDIEGRTVRFPSFVVGNDPPARIFVLAENEAVRARIAQALP